MKSILKCSILAMVFLACSCSATKLAEIQSDTYYPKAKKAFRIVSYNVGSFSKYMEGEKGSTEMIGRMIAEVKADVVGLNECDSVNTRHMTNQVADLAKEVGNWQWWFGRAMEYRDGAYGNGVILPQSESILDKYTVTLERGSGSEQRSIAVVETDNYVIGAAHLDHRSAEAQLAQARQVNAWAAEKYSHSKKPVFFVGDMNAQPDSKTIEALKEDWDVLSVPDLSYPSRGAGRGCIDYVFHYKGSRPVKVLASGAMTQFHNGDVTMASDHLPIYVDVKFSR